MRLDDARSWVVLSEWNEFVWPGPDLRRVAENDEFAYGMLSPGLFASIRNAFLAVVRSRNATRVSRT